jgi:hypothetical protein
MKLRSLLAGWLLFLGSGCSFMPYVGRNLSYTTADTVHECWFHAQLERAADDAWKRVHADDAHGQTSAAFADGFRQGYVGYVDGDGDGEPPTAPPRYYRSTLLRTTAGQQAILDWFAGYRMGADVARQEGLRELVVVPLGHGPRITDEGYRANMLPLRTDAPVTPTTPATLPPPRKLTAAPTIPPAPTQPPAPSPAPAPTSAPAPSQSPASPTIILPHLPNVGPQSAKEAPPPVIASRPPAPDASAAPMFAEFSTEPPPVPAEPTKADRRAHPKTPTIIEHAPVEAPKVASASPPPPPIPMPAAGASDDGTVFFPAVRREPDTGEIPSEPSR